jgi:uncharacterized protein DUF4340
MRGMKSFAALLVAAIGLGAYLYFVESKKTPGDDAAKKDKVFAVEADTIDEITIKSESGERTTLKKTGTDWAIVQPVAATPDASEVSGLTSNLASVEVQRVIDDNPTDLKEFGLAAPRVEVSFKAGGQPHILQIGDKTPGGTDLYAKLGDQKRVFLVSSFLDSTFNRATFDLRDKSVLKVDGAKVDALEVATGDRTLRFAKKDGEWDIEQPIATRADFGAVEGLVGKISSARMTSIAAAEATDLKPYGLDKPVATARVATGSSQAALAFGASSGEGAVYAKDLARPAVFTVESTLLDDLRKEAGDYRQKDLFDARAFNATRVEITRGGQTVTFEKTKVKDKDGKEEEKWKQAAPASRDEDNAKVEAFLSAATGARAMGFVASTAKTNLDKPELTITITFDQGKIDRVSFSRNGADGYALREGSPGAATIETATIDAILRAADGIK